MRHPLSSASAPRPSANAISAIATRPLARQAGLAWARASAGSRGARRCMAWPARVATNAAGALPGVAASRATRSAQRRSSSLQLGLAGCAVSNASRSVTSRARRSSMVLLGARSGERAPDQDLLDVARAFVDLADANVAVDALD